MFSNCKPLTTALLLLGALGLPFCPPAQSAGLTININTGGGGATGGLPPCNMDSFVYQAGTQAEAIYGDEGTYGPPPIYDGFTKASRINAGITGVNDAGLTTGHGSYMPDASGADEFIDAPYGEWGQSGSTGNSANNNIYGTPTFNYDPAPLDPTNKMATKGMPTIDPYSGSHGRIPVGEQEGSAGSGGSGGITTMNYQFGMATGTFNFATNPFTNFPNPFGSFTNPFNW